MCQKIAYKCMPIYIPIYIDACTRVSLSPLPSPPPLTHTHTHTHTHMGCHHMPKTCMWPPFPPVRASAWTRTCATEQEGKEKHFGWPPKKQSRYKGEMAKIIR
eukprot:jgi/Botrbrau1/14299/Bobra.0207s0004.1